MAVQTLATPTVEQVAKDIEHAYREGPTRGGQVLTGYLADKVEITHVPRLPGDGPRDGAPLAAMRLRETVAFERALKNFREDAQVQVEGDCLLVTKTISGERTSGDTVAETVTSKFRVAGGRIVEMFATSRSASFSVLADVLKEGGFTG